MCLRYVLVFLPRAAAVSCSSERAWETVATEGGLSETRQEGRCLTSHFTNILLFTIETFFFYRNPVQVHIVLDSIVCIPHAVQFPLTCVL